MSYHRLDAQELSVLDWLHPASQEELPKEMQTLGKIASDLCQLREAEGEKMAARVFWKIFQV